MSRICLFALFLILNIVVRFGDCENNAINEDYSANIDCVKDAPGSDKTRLSPIEKLLKGLKLPIDVIKDSNTLHKDNNTAQGSIHNVLEKASSFGLIFPGTLWCGDGDRAKNESDLGYFNKTDACCRAHDNCKNDILAGEIKVNLKNNGIFTRSACPCDIAFYKCLKNANSLLSKSIGDTYFNILQPQCFKCVCPTDGCNPQDGTECNDQCDKYQWIDNPKF